MYRLAYFPTYVDKRMQLSSAKRSRTQDIEDALEQTITGRPLRYPFFREKRLNGERLLFLIYEEEKVVLFVTITDKRTQQHDINYALGRLEQFRRFISR